MLRTARLAFALTAFATSAINARAERPVALLLSGDGAFRHSASGGRWALIETGVELYAGDSVEARSNELGLAFCPAGADSAGRLLRIPKGATVRLAANAFDATPVVPQSTPIPICVFPDLSRDRLASTSEFPTIPAPLPPRLDEGEQRALDL